MTITTELSTEATRLLAALRGAEANTRARALTHADLAKRCGLDRRTIIDAARELLDHGYLVLAACGTPRGCWLGTLHEALAYRAGLVRRVRHTAGRISALDVAIARHRGQLPLALEDSQ